MKQRLKYLSSELGGSKKFPEEPIVVKMGEVLVYECQNLFFEEIKDFFAEEQMIHLLLNKFRVSFYQGFNTQFRVPFTGCTELFQCQQRDILDVFENLHTYAKSKVPLVK